MGGSSGGFFRKTLAVLNPVGLAGVMVNDNRKKAIEAKKAVAAQEQAAVDENNRQRAAAAAEIKKKKDFASSLNQTGGNIDTTKSNVNKATLFGN